MSAPALWRCRHGHTVEGSQPAIYLCPSPTDPDDIITIPGVCPWCLSSVLQKFAEERELLMHPVTSGPVLPPGYEESLIDEDNDDPPPIPVLADDGMLDARSVLGIGGNQLATRPGYQWVQCAEGWTQVPVTDWVNIGGGVHVERPVYEPPTDWVHIGGGVHVERPAEPEFRSYDDTEANTVRSESGVAWMYQNNGRWKRNDGGPGRIPSKRALEVSILNQQETTPMNVKPLSDCTFIRRAENGGFILSDYAPAGYAPDVLGAFSSMDELVTYLLKADQKRQQADAAKAAG